MEIKSLPLHHCHVPKVSILINRTHTLFHSIAIALLIYYRLSFLLQETTTRHTPILPWLVVFAAELLLSFIWLLGQAYRWRPVSRTVFLERLPEDDKLPKIDVFICTADPEKEPTVEVMNTVLSAMSLDYPPEKLNVYVSDDGGSYITLVGIREAYKFAKLWVPFCRKYGVKTICPKAFFSGLESDCADFGNYEFIEETKRIKEKYKEFEESVTRSGQDKKLLDSSRNHPSVVEVIQENSDDVTQEDKTKMPLLVYVAREKRPSIPHHFKAGALNVLLRVSGVMSNSPIILGLDCDMYCNDPSSAKQALCFHLDPKFSPSLSFVQFPQRFHNISQNDIYDSQCRSAFRILWQGLDGQQGPILSGSGYYIKRASLYGDNLRQKGIDITEVRNSFGSSNEFIKSLNQNYEPELLDGEISSKRILQETKVLSSCTYERHTKWGNEVGFLHQSVAEDFFTGFMLQCKGWKSVYMVPSRPSFLGTSTTNLNDLLIQGTRWSSGLVDVGISKFCPLIYGTSRMSFLGSMCYAELSLFPLLYCLPLWCLATIPQLCLLFGIPLYPKASSSFFSLYLFIFISSLSKLLHEVFASGGSTKTWINEQRIWMIKSVTSHVYGSLDAILKRVGLREASFIPTNKAVDNEQVKRYQNGQFDFQTSPMFLVPLASLVILSLCSFVGGIVRTIFVGDWDNVFVQLCLSFYVLSINYVVLEGMVIRKDSGRIPPSVSVLSAILVMIFLFSGYVFLGHI